MHLSAFDYHGFQGQDATQTIVVTAVPQSVTITGLPDDSTATLGSSLSLGASVTAATTALQNAGFVDTWTVQFDGTTYGPYSGPSLNLTTDGVGVYAITLTAQDAEGVSNSATTSHQRRGPRAASVLRVRRPKTRRRDLPRRSLSARRPGQVCPTARRLLSSTGATTRPRRTRSRPAGTLPAAPTLVRPAGFLPGHRHRHRRLRRAGARRHSRRPSPGFRRRRRSWASRRRSMRVRASPSAAP